MTWPGGPRQRNRWAVQRAIARREAEAAQSFAQTVTTPGPLRAPGALSPAARVRQAVEDRELCAVLGRRVLPWRP